MIISRIKDFFCKHADTREGSCPFTGRTYSICNKCNAKKVIK